MMMTMIRTYINTDIHVD